MIWRPCNFDISIAKSRTAIDGLLDRANMLYIYNIMCCKDTYYIYFDMQFLKIAGVI